MHVRLSDASQSYLLTLLHRGRPLRMSTKREKKVPHIRTMRKGDTKNAQDPLNLVHTWYFSVFCANFIQVGLTDNLYFVGSMRVPEITHSAE